MDGWTAFWILYAYVGVCMFCLALVVAKDGVDVMAGVIFFGALWPIFLPLLLTLQRGGSR